MRLNEININNRYNSKSHIVVDYNGFLLYYKRRHIIETIEYYADFEERRYDCNNGDWYEIIYIDGVKHHKDRDGIMQISEKY